MSKTYLSLSSLEQCVHTELLHTLRKWINTTAAEHVLKTSQLRPLTRAKSALKRALSGRPGSLQGCGEQRKASSLAETYPSSGESCGKLVWRRGLWEKKNDKENGKVGGGKRRKNEEQKWILHVITYDSNIDGNSKLRHTGLDISFERTQRPFFLA